jgi:predicted KAP-like P-loop ATPase
MTTPRDVYRLVNALSVSFPAVKDEVDAADFVAIEALRVFRNDLYNNIKNNKHFFTSHYAPNAEHTFVQGILRAESNKVQTLISELFPNLRGGMFGHSDTHRWRKEFRVCSPEVFDVYFQFAMPRSGVSRREMMGLIQLALHDEELTEFFTTLAKNDFTKCRRILDRFLDYVSEIGSEEAVAIIRIFLNIGDEIIDLDERSSEPPGTRLPLRWALSTTVVELLKKYDQSKQYETLLPILSEARSCDLALDVVYRIGATHGMYENNSSPEYDKIMKAEDLAGLEKVAIEKIKTALQSIAALDSRKLRNILHFWTLVDSDAAKTWVQTTLNDSASQLMNFIKGFIAPIGIDHFEVSDTLFLYFDVIALRARVSNYLNHTELNEVEHRVAEVFMQATDKYANLP